jgi:hypothetical protein
MIPAGGMSAGRDPHKMPGQYWAYGFYVLVGVVVLVPVFAILVVQAEWLVALGGLPAAQGPRGDRGGALFRGQLRGEPLRTPLGQPAVAWVGIVEVTVGHGRGTITQEKCRLGSLGGLSLATPFGAMPIADPAPAAVEVSGDIWRTRSRRPYEWLGPSATVAPIPERAIEDCRLDRQALAKDRWAYVEHRAPPGSLAAVAGCAAGGVIARCPSGVAVGHLSVGGMRTLVRHLAASTLSVAALLTLLMSFFTIVGGASAVLVLRRAARRARGLS